MKIEKIVKSGLALMLTALLCATAEASLLIGNKTNGVTSTNVTVAVGAEVTLLLYNNSTSSSSATYNICIGNNTNTVLSYTDSGQYYKASVENRSIKYKSQETRELTIRGLKKTSSAQVLNVYKNSGSSSKVTINITVTGEDAPTPAEVVTFDFNGCQVTATNATKTMVGDEPVLTFTKNGTLNLSRDIVADVLVVGGGGGGGGAYYGGSSSKYNGNGGNGGEVKYCQGRTLPASVLLTAAVGTAGEGGEDATKSTAANDGKDGGDSSLSGESFETIFANKGTAGKGGTSGTNNKAGSAGTGAASIDITGNPVAYGAAGAQSPQSTGTATDVTSANGQGGQGGRASGTQANRKGGKGGSGIVVVRLKEVSIPREEIPWPTVVTGLVYGGTNQTCVVAGEHYVRGGTYEATDAGSYTATVTPESGYCWPDQSYGAKTFNWSIAKRPVTVSVVATNKVEGAEEPIYPTVAEGFVDDDAEVSWKVWRTNLVEQADGSLGLGEEVGTYDLVIAGSASETANYTINYVNGVGAFEIREAIVEIAVPTAATGLVYDGTVQTGVVAGVGYELTGTVTATDAGNYEATATPQSGYRWTGGSTEAQTIPWSIAKLPVTVTPDAGQEKTVGVPYTITYASDPATLVGEDTFTGALTAADVVGEQPITKGTLALSDNYKLTVDETVTLLVKAAGPSISEDEGMIDYNPEKKEVVVTPNDGETNIEIINMPSDVTAKVPTSVDTVKGVEPEKIQVIYTPEAAGSRTYDITGAFDVAGDKTTGVTITLKDDPTATVDVPVGDTVETIKVTPELTEAGDAVVEPLTVQESEVDLGAKTIPGLTYSLKRSTEIGGTTETVDSKCADSIRTKLTDPMKGGKPPQAFYTIEVAK